MICSYVDDSVSPEEIMKKFEQLEEIQKKKAEMAKAVWEVDGLMKCRMLLKEMRAMAKLPRMSSWFNNIL